MGIRALKKTLSGDNMNISTVTSWNNDLFEKYAFRFYETYNWDFPLVVYNEDENMYNDIPQCKEFVDRHNNDFHMKYKSNYRFDAVRFCYKVYAYTDMILNSEAEDGIIFIDADSVFHGKVDLDWVKQFIHRGDCMMTYLGRGDHYSECGFIYFNMNHPEIKNFAREMQDMYNTDQLLGEAEWHDSWIFDVVRKRFESRGVKNYNIGDGQWGENGHVQARSILGTVYDHTKGARKIDGKSPENDFCND